jgi:glycosyltransferase involved in cell wall biosynthesis
MSLCSLCNEGFSNVVGEAMACGLPRVITDVGYSAFIVGDTGRVVLPGNPTAICVARRELLDMSGGERESLGQAARCRVQEYFSLPTITRQYEQLYKDIVRVHADSMSLVKE